MGSIRTARRSGAAHERRYHTIAQADQQAAEITAIGRYEITGGTRRLAGVTGKGVIAAAGSLAPPFGFSDGLFGRIAF